MGPHGPLDQGGHAAFTELVLTDNPVEAACFHYDPTCRSQALYIKTGVYAPSTKLPRRAPRKKNPVQLLPTAP